MEGKIMPDTLSNRNTYGEEEKKRYWLPPNGTGPEWGKFRDLWVVHSCVVKYTKLKYK